MRYNILDNHTLYNLNTDYNQLYRKYPAKRKALSELLRYMNDYYNMTMQGINYPDDKVDALFVWSKKIYKDSIPSLKNIFFDGLDKEDNQTMAKIKKRFSGAKSRLDKVIAIETLIHETHGNLPILQAGLHSGSISTQWLIETFDNMAENNPKGKYYEPNERMIRLQKDGSFSKQSNRTKARKAIATLGKIR